MTGSDENDMPALPRAAGGPLAPDRVAPAATSLQAASAQMMASLQLMEVLAEERPDAQNASPGSLKSPVELIQWDTDPLALDDDLNAFYSSVKKRSVYPCQDMVEQLDNAERILAGTDAESAPLKLKAPEPPDAGPPQTAGTQAELPPEGARNEDQPLGEFSPAEGEKKLTGDADAEADGDTIRNELRQMTGIIAAHLPAAPIWYAATMAVTRLGTLKIEDRPEFMGGALTLALLGGYEGADKFVEERHCLYVPGFSANAQAQMVCGYKSWFANPEHVVETSGDYLRNPATGKLPLILPSAGPPRGSRVGTAKSTTVPFDSSQMHEYQPLLRRSAILHLGINEHAQSLGRSEMSTAPALWLGRGDLVWFCKAIDCLNAFSTDAVTVDDWLDSLTAFHDEQDQIDFAAMIDETLDPRIARIRYNDLLQLAGGLDLRQSLTTLNDVLMSPRWAFRGEGKFDLTDPGSVPPSYQVKPADDATDDSRENPVTLAHVEGIGEAEKIAHQLISDLRAWSTGGLAWADAVTSALFYGEPGTGKTYLGRAMAGSMPEAHFIMTSLSHFTATSSKDGGNAVVQRMAQIFQEARDKAPTILFIDEIDGFAQRTGADHNNASYNRFMVNALLEQMNPETREGVMVIAACNNIDQVDDALKRNGRIDFRTEIMLPGERTVKGLLQRKLGHMLDIDPLVTCAIGRPLADIDAIIRRVRSQARLQGEPLSLEKFQLAFNPTQTDLTPIKRRTAVHECGHAIVALALGDRVVRRLVIRTNGGGAAYIETGPTEGIVRNYIDQIAVLMAGKAAENLLLDTHGGGIGGSRDSDLARATRLSIAMEARLGLVDEKSVYFDGKDDEWLRHAGRPGVAERIAEGEACARGILAANRHLLQQMSAELAQRQVMEASDIEEWAAKVKMLKGRKRNQPGNLQAALSPGHATMGRGRSLRRRLSLWLWKWTV